MTQLGKQRYRLQFAPFIDQGEWTEDATTKQLNFPAGTDLEIQLGVREKTNPLTFYDLTNVDSMTLEVKDLAASDTAPAADAATLMAATVNSLDAATISGDDWAAGTAQHVTFNFTAVASNLTIGKKWLVVSAVLTDTSQVSLGWGRIEVVEDGTGPNTPVDPLDPSYYTSAQTDALLAALTNVQSVAVSGTTKTMQASDEGKRLRFTNVASCALTLIEFSEVGVTLYVRQHTNTSPTLGTLPAGMTVNGAINFDALSQHQDGCFICVDATPGAQVIDYI